MMDASENLQLQRSHNSYHLDGRPEKDDEEALDWALDLCKRVENLPHDTFLDAGCRLGYAAEEIKKAYPDSRVIGCDIVPEFVMDTEERCDGAKVADICDLPFDSRTFDWVFCSQTLEHTLDPQRAAEELVRVSRHGVYVSVPLQEPSAKRTHEDHHQFNPDPLWWVNLFVPFGVRFQWGEIQPNGAFNFLVRTDIEKA